MRSPKCSRSVRLVRAIHTALWLAILAWGSTALAESPREVAARVHRAGGYADDLPVRSASDGERFVFPTGAGGGGDREARERRPSKNERAGPRERSSRELPMPAAGSSVLSYLLLAVGIALVVGLLFWILTSIRPRAGADVTAAPPVRVRRGEEAAIPLGVPLIDGDPDALAAAGRYEEAIGAALVRGLYAVGWRPEGLQRSRTAREILASSPSDRRAELAALVAIEERVAFGGEDATEARWREARQHWRALDREPA